MGYTTKKTIKVSKKVRQHIVHARTAFQYPNTLPSKTMCENTLPETKKSAIKKLPSKNHYDQPNVNLKTCR